MQTVKREVTTTATKEYDADGKLVKETETTKEVEYVEKESAFIDIKKPPIWYSGDGTIQLNDGGFNHRVTDCRATVNL